jgi:sulfoxide reductase heme-binding subunit YedZ
MVQRLNGWLRRVPVWPLYGLALLPALWWLWQGLTGGLGADPVKVLEHALGLTALQFLIVSLTVTPLRALTGITLLRFRRMLGLTAFWYALAHVTVYAALDMGLLWGAILVDVTKRPYVIAGALAFVALLPLAATSSDRAVRRLGAARWRALHRLAYAAGVLAALHFLWLTKVWTVEAISYALVIAALLGWRAWDAQARRRARGLHPAGA